LAARRTSGRAAKGTPICAGLGSPEVTFSYFKSLALRNAARKSAFHLGQLHAHDAASGHENQIYRFGQVMLVESVGLAQKTPSPIPNHRSTYFSTGDHSQMGSGPSDSLSQLAMRQPLAKRSPCRRQRAKSRVCFSRALRPKPRRAGVMPAMRQGLYRRQALAANAAAVAEHSLAALG